MPKTIVDRPFSFRLPMSAAERDTLQDLVDDSAMTAAAYVRQLLRREHAKRFGAQPAVRRTTTTKGRKK